MIASKDADGADRGLPPPGQSRRSCCTLLWQCFVVKRRQRLPGLDLTRRDLQFAMRDKGLPWDFGKDFEHAAVIAPITPAAAWGPPAVQRIQLNQNGAVKQDAVLSDMIFSVAELIAYLSRFYHLQPGDLLYTGTPAGVGPFAPGDVLRGTIEGLEPVELTIAAAE